MDNIPGKLIIAGALSAIAACSSGSDPSAPATGALQAPIIDGDLIANAASVSCDAPAALFAETMEAMINESRQNARSCGDDFNAPAVGQVSWNSNLTTAAENHANDMDQENFFYHTGSDGLGVSHRATNAGYVWRAIGENIAAGQLNIQEVHEGWLASDGHCRNIMNADYTEVGAACVLSSNTNYGSYWVVVFGDSAK